MAKLMGLLWTRLLAPILANILMGYHEKGVTGIEGYFIIKGILMIGFLIFSVSINAVFQTKDHAVSIYNSLVMR